MALRTSLTWIKRRFARAIRQLADHEQWARNHYEFTGTYDESSGRFSLVFGTDYPTRGKELYRKIKDALRAEFPDHPSIISSIGLMIQEVGPGRLEEVYQQLMIAEDDVDLGDLLA